MSLPTSIEEIVAALRRSYRDAIRISAWEEILAELAEDAVTVQLHADTARFHHGSAHAHAQALELLLFFRGEEETFDIHGDKHEARTSTREPDLAHMRCQGRRYRAFRPRRELGLGGA